MRYTIEGIKGLSFDELDNLGVSIEEVKTGMTTISDVDGFERLEELENGEYSVSDISENVDLSQSTSFNISFDNFFLFYENIPASEVPLYIFKYLIIEDIIDDTQKLKEEFSYLIGRDKNGEIDNFIISNDYFLLSEKVLAFKTYDLTAISISNAEIEYIKSFLNQRNPDDKAKRMKYEKFKLQWMLDHGYTLKDLFEILDDYSKGYHYHYDSYPSVSEMKDDFFDGGFHGEIYPSYEEWLDNEEEENYYD